MPVGGFRDERHRQQAHNSLLVANQTRLGRANIKRDMKAGRISVHDILENIPECLETMTLFDLILSIRGVGKQKALTVLNKLKLSPAKTLETLTERQIRELNKELWRF